MPVLKIPGKLTKHTLRSSNYQSVKCTVYHYPLLLLQSSSHPTTEVRSLKSPARKNQIPGFKIRKKKQSYTTCCWVGSSIVPATHRLFLPAAAFANDSFTGMFPSALLMDIDSETAKLAIGFLGPFLSAFGFLFILRIVMSWYPKLPVEFPYVVAYALMEPILVQTRKIIPPLAGVDVTPVVWFGLISFVNEILVGPQGLLVLLSQKV